MKSSLLNFWYIFDEIKFTDIRYQAHLTCNFGRTVVAFTTMDKPDQPDFQPLEVIEEAGYVPRTKRKRDGFNRQDVVNAFQSAFDIIGGTTRLALWANANPDKFYPLYAKLLPSTAVVLGNTAMQQIVHAIPPSPLDMHPGAEDVQFVEMPPPSEGVPRE